MPFGHHCEFEDFAHCVRVMRGKVRNPDGWCASLMRETERRCAHREKAVELPAEKAGLFARLFGRPAPAPSYALDVVATDGCKATVETKR